MATFPAEPAPPSNLPPGDGAPLLSDAWLGDAPASGALDAELSLRWAAAQIEFAPPKRTLRGGVALDLADWRDPNVGWGLVVPDRDDVCAAAKADGCDLLDPLRELLAHRDAPVFRWRAELTPGVLRRYRSNGNASDLNLRGRRGVGDNSVPHYLLIAAGPAQVPWSVQYRLQLDAFVGRIDLADKALACYVAALKDDFVGSTRPRSNRVIWAVDHGPQDITGLMRSALAEPMAKQLAAVPGGVLSILMGSDATCDTLLTALARCAPTFVLTSSHGATFPLDQPDTLRTQLGLPVDQQHQLLDLKAMGAWAPDGCIWYAQACCSAGADGSSLFSNLFSADSSLARTLDAIAGAGPCISPLPQQLLSADKPARAFIGHIEPTFDWTLRDPKTQQVTTQSLVDAMCLGLLAERGQPVGMALDRHFRAVGGLLLDHVDALSRFNANSNQAAADLARRAKLTAIDRLAMVLLGDPTVALPHSVPS